MFETLTLEFTGQLATLTLNRPDKRNAINAKMVSEMQSALDDIETSHARVAIITSAGKSFCAGMDLEMLSDIASQSSAENMDDSRRMGKMFRRIWSFSKPLIAAVNGAALAGGCGIATLCDFTLAAPEAKFGYPEVRIGFLPAVVSIFLVRQIGEKRARDLLLSGRIIDAAEAHRIGLVTQLVPAKELMIAAQILAANLLECSPASLHMTKKLLCDFAAPEIDREQELAKTESARIRSTEDFQEGLSSFLEKRPPRWSGK